MKIKSTYSLVQVGPTKKSLIESTPTHATVFAALPFVGEGTTLTRAMGIDAAAARRDKNAATAGVRLRAKVPAIAVQIEEGICASTLVHLQIGCNNRDGTRLEQHVPCPRAAYVATATELLVFALWCETRHRHCNRTIC
ncbi:MAG: hypothetical protein N2595_09465 [bacterium]|nr:hypothetical protein [bacterium]